MRRCWQLLVLLGVAWPAVLAADPSPPAESTSDPQTAAAPAPEDPVVALPPDQVDADPASYPREEGARTLKRGEIELFSKVHRPAVRGKLYRPNGTMSAKVAGRIDRIFRSKGKRSRRRRIDRRLMAILYDIGQHYGRRIELVSGYRPKKRRRGRRRKRRGLGSRHGLGRAADIRVAGVPPLELAHFIKGRYTNIGVGYYPTSKFVHVDVRKRTYYWWDISGPGQRQKNKALPIERTGNRRADWTRRGGTRLPKAMRWAPAKKTRKKKKRRKRSKKKTAG